MFGINVVSRNSKYSDSFLEGNKKKMNVNTLWLRFSNKFQFGTNQDAMVGKSGVTMRCISKNHENPVIDPIIEPTIT